MSQRLDAHTRDLIVHAKRKSRPTHAFQYDDQRRRPSRSRSVKKTGQSKSPARAAAAVESTKKKELKAKKEPTTSKRQAKVTEPIAYDNDVYRRETRSRSRTPTREVKGSRLAAPRINPVSASKSDSNSVQKKRKGEFADTLTSTPVSSLADGDGPRSKKVKATPKTPKSNPSPRKRVSFGRQSPRETRSSANKDAANRKAVESMAMHNDVNDGSFSETNGAAETETEGEGGSGKSWWFCNMM